MLGWSKILKSIFTLISNKNQPIKPEFSSIALANHEKIQNFHENFMPDAILDNSAILRKFQKQKQMVYLGSVDNISAFRASQNMLYWQRYGRFCKSRFF